MAKLVDALDLGSSGAIRESSSLSVPTILSTCFWQVFVFTHHNNMTTLFDVLPKSTITNKPVLHFVHANGFVAKVYLPLIECWQRIFSVEVIEIFGTNDNYPIDEHWQSLTEQVLDNIAKVCQKHGVAKLVAVGHSVGAVTTLQALSKDPTHISQAVLLDPSFLMGKYSFLYQLAKIFDKPLGYMPKFEHYFIDKLSPASKSKYRRDAFENRQVAHQNLKNKTLFRNFDKRCFELYIEHGFINQPHQITLTIAKKYELAIFRTIPSLYWLYKPTIYRPTTIIAGKDSYFTQIGSYQNIAKKWQIPIVYTSGSHMFVLEHPTEVANLVLKTILKQIKTP